MSCRAVYDKDGKIVGIWCSRGSKAKCLECGGSWIVSCDWKLKGAKAGQTCSRKLCDRCAYSPAPNKHLCPVHRRLYEQWLAKRPENRA